MGFRYGLLCLKIGKYCWKEIPSCNYNATVPQKKGKRIQTKSLRVIYTDRQTDKVNNHIQWVVAPGHSKIAYRITPIKYISGEGKGD